MDGKCLLFEILFKCIIIIGKVYCELKREKLLPHV